MIGWKLEVGVASIIIQQDKSGIFANSVDPDEMAQNESSHQDLHCHSLLDLQLSPFWHQCVRIQRWKGPFLKLKGERVRLELLSHFKKRLAVVE